MRRSRNKALVCLREAFIRQQRCCNTDGRQPYRRRSSDPQTIREIGNFQRDLRFSKRRPLPTAPWLQDKKRTYMDDAERLYGRKETWCKVKDVALREKLASLLQDCLKDMIDATKLEVRSAKKYMQLTNQMDSEYRSYVAAATFSFPHALRSWALTVCQKEGEENRLLSAPCGAQEGASSCEDGATSPLADEECENATNEGGQNQMIHLTRRKFLESRRRQGEEAVLENTPATMDLLKDEKRTAPYSAFPFLRQRAMEKETTLDPSLVDWTAKYFPEDDDRTFSSPPKLHRDTEEGGTSSASSIAPTSTGNNDSPYSKPNARRRLQRSLRLHEDMHRPTFDAEGVFYRVRRQGNEEDRAAKPRAARGSDAKTDRNGEVVKVPWDTVVKANEQGYSVDVLRAKERLLRLSRGEDPATIP
ncbi:putative U4/U6 small nuclear ribonuclear protein [Trypanosoma rangeli]|uniref:Putative U4/U6 small nuclear ribonuclear protein n=1 Tax=Trypanosoma rangeli TaxID=5698 RepID=A0A3R7M5S0_TRYRA|nr:putative U4/U6 small nuclear ribonuclear protein [Trypanosoma rangeli]RNE99913.1 putative U4/U6 small nuclear ribonuclear protein [Trypanosoma rangeli]|eukprot:RNE99913.1 putative U4/U6 small nuclear ribonuclear protein [Trypanosoma rangeli]